VGRRDDLFEALPLPETPDPSTGRQVFRGAHRVDRSRDRRRRGHGAHSGNILNGDYSVGLCPGLYVENGEIMGHVKDAMVAGNIFETLKEVIDIEDTTIMAPEGTSRRSLRSRQRGHEGLIVR